MNILYNKILTHKYIPKPIGVLLVIAINWVFQGILYTKKTETAMKIILELIIIILFYFLLFNIFKTWHNVLIVSLLISHTISWLVNNNLFSLFKTFGVVHTDLSTMSKYIEKLHIESQKNHSIMWVGIYGSYSKGLKTTDSDLDVRVIKYPGLVNALWASIFILKQRIWSNLHKFPLDIFLLDDMEELSYMLEKAIEIKSPNLTP